MQSSEEFPRPSRWMQLRAVLVLLPFFLVVLALLVLLPDWDQAPLSWDWDVAPVSREENGFAQLLEAARSLPGGPDLRERLESIEEHPEDWLQQAQELFQGSERVFELLSLALVHGKMLWPPLESLDSRMPYIQPVQNLLHFLGLRARVLLALGLPQQSLQLAWQMLEVGQQLEEGKGLIIHLRMAHRWKVQGLTSLQDLLGPQGLSADRYPEVLHRLGDFAPKSPSLLQAFHGEFSLFAKKLEELGQSEEAWHHAGLGSLLPLSGISYFFQPNRTLHLFSDFDAAIQKQLDEPCGRQPWLKQWESPDDFSLLDWIRPNAIGRLLFQQQKPALAGVFWMRCEQDTRLKAVQSLFALAAYEEREAQLPQDLKSLVPDFLPHLPTDMLTGKPFLYEPTRRLFWSPGLDLEEDGGIETRDLVFDLPPRSRER